VGGRHPPLPRGKKSRPQTRKKWTDATHKPSMSRTEQNPRIMCNQKPSHSVASSKSMASARARRFPLQSLPPKFLSHKKKKDDEEFVNETTPARCELRAYLCCSSTRSERSFRLTRMIATNAIFIICVTRVVVSNRSGVRAVVLCLLLSLSLRKKKAKIFYRRFEITLCYYYK